VGTGSTRFVEDDAGGLLDPARTLRSRLVAGFGLSPTPRVKLEVELEALSGFLAGDTTALGTSAADRPFPVAHDGRDDLARVLPRKAYVAWSTDVGRVIAGAQSFSWGTGMLANDGSDGDGFGQGWLGNLVARLAFAARPLARTSLPGLLRSAEVFLAGDFVLRDDNASIYDGDRAFAGVLGVRTRVGEHALGLLASARHQIDREDPYRPDGERAKTTVVVLDAHGRLAWPLGERFHLGVEGEVAGVLGRSTRPWSDATWDSGSTVQQLGAVTRLRLEHRRWRVAAALEGGYASGDNDPLDDVSHTFTMHTDHRVGLVLFDQVLPMLSARGADRLVDPTLVGQPPPGTRFAINPGAVQNAVYGNLVLRARPLRQLDLRLGYLFAAPAADIIDAYQSALRGGYATSYGGRVQSRGAYGHELDARATWELELPAMLRLRVGAEGGVLFPGDAFAGVLGLRPDDGDPRPVWLGRAMLSLFW
jgi:hypothetical protein